jgi:hypothetical protein
MITEIVQFDLPAGMTRADVLAKYRQTAPGWAGNADLLRKYYFFDAARSLGGGVYVWKNREAALRAHGEGYRARIRALYGSEPRMNFFDTLVLVDNLHGEVSEPEAV